MVKLKKTMKKIGKIFLCFLLVVALVNILAPLFCKKPDGKLSQKICSRQNLLLRQQGQKESAVSMITKKHFCGGFE